MKHCAMFLAVLISLFGTSCTGQNEEIVDAQADYLQAKTRQLIAEARIKEAEAELREIEIRQIVTLQAQQLEQKQQSWKAAEARRDSFERIMVETLRALAYVLTAVIAISALTWAIAGAYEVWAKSRQEALETQMEEAQAKAQQ